jgi:hypothetical protein
MDATTKAFHELILQANRAHKAYNDVGHEAALLALQDLYAQTEALAHHIHNDRANKSPR